MTGPRAIRLTLGLAMRADPPRFVAGFVLAVFEALSFGFSAYGLKLLTDAAVHHDRHAAVIAAAITAVLATGSAAANWVGWMVRVRLKEETELALDLRLLELTMDTPTLEHFERPDYADEVELLRSQRAELSVINDIVVHNFQVALQGVTVLGLLARVHPLLLLLPVFGVPSVLATVRGEAARQSVIRDTAPTQRLRTHLYRLLTTPGPAKEIRVFDLGAELGRRLHDIGDRTDRAMTAVETRSALLGAAGWFAFSLGFIAAIAFVSVLALRRGTTVTPGDVVLTVALSRQINQQVGALVALSNYLVRVLKTGKRFLWLSDHFRDACAAATSANPVAVPSRLRDGVTLHEVGFRYPGTDRDVLDGVTVHLPAGSTVAIVGDNGAGKTTIVKLLARFYDPTAGRILIDGTDLRDLPADDWRHSISAGFQDFARFEFLAREVVGVGSLPDIDDLNAVQSALERAHASDVVVSLRDGFTTQLGRSFTDGRELSGGQWQKLALGRAMMRDAPLVLLLDEPTSSLDAVTEHALFERYASAAKRVAGTTGAITVFVSHRFSTVRMADMILVIDDRHLAEVGTHEELMRHHGLYAQLYELQAQAYR